MAVYTSSGTYVARTSVAIDERVSVNSVTLNVEECKQGTLVIAGENVDLITQASMHNASGALVPGVQIALGQGTATSRTSVVKAACWSGGTHGLVLKTNRTVYSRIYSPDVYKGPTTISATTTCGAGDPIDCSSPYLVNVISPSTMLFANKIFKPACRIHDFCYRHGQVTYQHTKTKCDNDFEGDLNSICQSSGGIAAALGSLGATAVDCAMRAQEFTAAVRNFGNSSYRTSTSNPPSTFCRYQRRM